MKELQKYGFLRFVCVLVLLTWLCLDGFSQEVKWKQTDNVYIKTSTGIKLSKVDAVIIKSNEYILSRSNMRKINENQILYFSPIWFVDDSTNGFAIDNEIILYNVYNLHTLIHDIVLTDNLISVDSIKGTPTIYILAIRNHSYSQIITLCEILKKGNYCQIAEPNFTFFSSTKESVSMHPERNTLWGDQWGLHKDLYPNYDVNAEEAWNFSTGKGIKVAVTDNGFELLHPDLADNVYSSYDCTDGADGSVNGQYVITEDRHGTQCAGIISAVNNHIGIVGVAPDSKLILIRDSYTTMSGQETISHSKTSWSIAAIRKAYQAGADVISNSWSYHASHNYFTTLDTVLWEATNIGRDGKGCVVVFSTGNQGRTFVNYPSNSPYTIAVGAMNYAGLRYYASNYGQGLDVVAPGEDIITTQIIPYGSYCESTGTSFACPMVSGIAALIISIRPDLTDEEVRTIIRNTAYKLPTYSFNVSTQDGNWNNQVGYGLIDAYAAVMAAKNRFIQNKTYLSGTSIVEYYPEITAGYSVIDSLPYGNVIVKSGSNVTYKATDAIHLRSGFRVEKGANFRAYIAPAASNSSSAPSTFRDNSDEDSAPAEMKTINAESSFSVFPNPATDRVTISSSEPIAQTMLYNLNGQLVLQTTEMEINVSTLPAGVYVVHAQSTNGQLLTAKFVHL